MKKSKKSNMYNFELTEQKPLAPVSRYNGFSKLYQLNLSKMMLRCPDSLFPKKEGSTDTPEDLLVISTVQMNAPQNTKRIVEEMRIESHHNRISYRNKKALSNNKSDL